MGSKRIRFKYTESNYKKIKRKEIMKVYQKDDKYDKI